MNAVENLQKSPFSLVLSGGGALGIAHLGVIADMERFKLEPDEIIGTSMGAIIGACLAIGMKEKDIVKALKHFGDSSNWINLSLRGNSVIDDKKIKEIFEYIFGNRKICETKIPLKIIATELLSGEKYIFSSSSTTPIVDALLATMAIPGIFKEQHINSLILADGFLCENIGILEATKSAILAVDVMGKNSFDHSLPDSFFKTSNIVQMLERSIQLLIYNQTKSAISQCQKPLYLIEPKTFPFKTFDFNKVNKIRALGLGLLEKL